MTSEAITDVYLFESEKERAFRMERRKFYQQNKKVVDEILKSGRRQDVAKGLELTCAMYLFVLEDGPQSFYNFSGEFKTPSTVLGGDETENLEGLVKEVKHALQSYNLYGATNKGWFYTFNEQKPLSTKEEVAQAQENFVQNLKDNPERYNFLANLAENEEEKQALADVLQGKFPEAHNLVTRGLTPEERKEFVRIYNI